MESKDYPDGLSLFFLLFQQFFASVTLQYFHLLNGYLIESNQSLTLLFKPLEFEGFKKQGCINSPKYRITQSNIDLS